MQLRKILTDRKCATTFSLIDVNLFLLGKNRTNLAKQLQTINIRHKNLTSLTFPDSHKTPTDSKFFHLRHMTPLNFRPRLE